MSFNRISGFITPDGPIPIPFSQRKHVRQIQTKILVLSYDNKFHKIEKEDLKACFILLFNQDKLEVEDLIELSVPALGL